MNCSVPERQNINLTLNKTFFSCKSSFKMKTISSNICKGDIQQLKQLKSQDPSFHWLNIPQSKTKETILHLAAQHGYTEILSFLLNNFTPKGENVRNIDNKTPLHEAAQFGNYNCVKILVENGADVNAIKRSDWTALMLACTKSGEQYEKIVEYLIENGAFLNFKNKDGWSSLHLAARNPNHNILKIILSSKQAECKMTTKNGRNALHIASLHGNIKNVELLLNIELDPNSVDCAGNSPFHEAVLSGNIEIIDLLAKCGADSTILNKMGLNSLHFAASQDLHDVIEHLVKKYNCDINCVDLNGHTPLHHAARKNNPNSINTLIKLGGNVEILDNKGKLAKDYLNDSFEQ